MTNAYKVEDLTELKIFIVTFVILSLMLCCFKCLFDRFKRHHPDEDPENAGENAPQTPFFANGADAERSQNARQIPLNHLT